MKRQKLLMSFFSWLVPICFSAVESDVEIFEPKFLGVENYYKYRAWSNIFVLRWNKNLQFLAAAYQFLPSWKWWILMSTGSTELLVRWDVVFLHQIIFYIWIHYFITASQWLCESKLCKNLALWTSMKFSCKVTLA